MRCFAAGIQFSCTPNNLMPSAPIFASSSVLPQTTMSAVDVRYAVIFVCNASILSLLAYFKFIEIKSISIEDPEYREGRADYEVVISHGRGAEERLRGSVEGKTRMTIDRTTYGLLFCSLLKTLMDFLQIHPDGKWNNKY